MICNAERKTNEYRSNKKRKKQEEPEAKTGAIYGADMFGLDVKDYDQAEYKTALAAVRPQHEQSARAKIKELFGKIGESDFEHAKDAVSKAIGEWQSPKSVTEELGWEEEKPDRKPETKSPGREKNRERYDDGR